MAWVRFDDGFFRHPKVVTAGRDARDLYMASVFYANSNLTDGYIPEGALRLIAADAGITTHAKATKALLTVGLWVPTEGGYQIHDYLEYQSSAAAVTASREANAKRQEEWRNKQRNRGGNTPRNDVSNGVTNGPVTAPPINIPNTTTTSDEVVTPIPPKRDTSDKPTGEVDANFAVFWDAYPNKVDKQEAKAKFRKVNWKSVDFDSVMASLERQKQSAQWTKDNGQFIPGPAKWIYREKWTDELPAKRPTPPDSGGRITSIDQLFADGDTDEPTGYTEDFSNPSTRMATEWPRQTGDTGVDVSAGRDGFRAIAGGRS